MEITKVDPFILRVPVTGGAIADSVHTISHWGVPGVILETDLGLRGYGICGTHGFAPGDDVIVRFIRDVYGPFLLGQSWDDPRALTRRLQRHPPILWIGRAGISQIALAAIDVALWDLVAKTADRPLWQILGGTEPRRIAAYDTDGGWLSYDLASLVANARRSVEERGFRGVKIKVGHADPSEDLRRVEAVRRAIGGHAALMVDANGRWELETALAVSARLADLDVRFVEEPLWYDDVESHAALAAQIRTPIALGEQIYSTSQFRTFMRQRAVQVVQPDVVRLAGVSEWTEVADDAHAAGLEVVAHAGDMSQVHVHTSLAHPACTWLEYIPWIRDCFLDPVTVTDGDFEVPRLPGAGTTLRPDALDRFGVRVT